MPRPKVLQIKGRLPVPSNVKSRYQPRETVLNAIHAQGQESFGSNEVVTNVPLELAIIPPVDVHGKSVEAILTDAELALPDIELKSELCIEQRALNVLDAVERVLLGEVESELARKVEAEPVRSERVTEGHDHGERSLEAHVQGRKAARTNAEVEDSELNSSVDDGGIELRWGGRPRRGPAHVES